MMPASFRSSSRAALMTLALALAGCGDPTTEPTTPLTPTDTNPPGSTGPVYAITAQVLSGATPQTYVILSSALEGNTKLSLDKAIELPSRSLGVGIPGKGRLYTAGSENGSVTRWDLQADGTLKKGESVSFEGKGIKDIGEYQGQFQFVSETKAYYFDGRAPQIIVWNPTDMTVTSSIPLTGLTVTGASLIFSAAPVVLDNQILMTAGWRTGAGSVIKQAGVISINTTTDAVTTVTDSRCGYVRDGAVGADGQVYLATEVYGAAAYRMNWGETPPVPCLLKFDPVALKFDPSFYKELSSLTGGAATGSLLPGPSKGLAYVRVLDETVRPVTAGEHPRLIASAAAWNWWQLKLDTMTAVRVTTLPPTTGSTFLHRAGDKTIFTEFAGQTSTTLRQLTGEGGQAVSNTDGLVFSFLQLR